MQRAALPGSARLAITLYCREEMLAVAEAVDYLAELTTRFTSSSLTITPILLRARGFHSMWLLCQAVPSSTRS